MNEICTKTTALIGATFVLGSVGFGTVTASQPADPATLNMTAYTAEGTGGDGFPIGCTNTNGGSGSPNTETHVHGNGTGTGTGTGGGIGVETSQPNGPGGSASDENSAAAGGTGCPPSAPGVFGAGIP